MECSFETSLRIDRMLIWGHLKELTVSTDIKKEFDSKPVYNKEFLIIKTKSHGD